MEKSDKIVLSKYEVSVIGMLAITLIPTGGALLFQITGGLPAGVANNFGIYFVTGAAFLDFFVFYRLI